MRTIDMLSTEPQTAKLVLKAFWKKLRRDKIELFEVAWKIVEPKAALFALDAQYEEWETSGGSHKGMKHKQFRRKHGIVRSQSHFFISESSYRHDKLHGLQIKISNVDAVIGLYHMGDRLAYFSFNGNFLELQRDDARKILAEWSSDHLKA